MLRYLLVAVISFGSVVSGGRCSAKDLEPVESAKAQKVKLPIKGKMVARLNPGSLAAGQAGVFVKSQVHPNTRAIIQYFDHLKVISVVDDSNLIVEYDQRNWAMSVDHESSTTHRYISFWLKGFSTKGVVDDDNVTIPWVVDVTGTKKYTTSAGTQSTVLLIEPHQQTDKERKAEEEQRKADEQAAQKQQQAAEEAAKKERQAKEDAAQKRQKEKQAELDRNAAAEKALWRVWTDASGTHTMEARFKSMIGDQVKLLKRDGTQISVPLEKLSEEDREWIRDRKKH